MNFSHVLHLSWQNSSLQAVERGYLSFPLKFLEAVVFLAFLFKINDSAMDNRIDFYFEQLKFSIEIFNRYTFTYGKHEGHKIQVRWCLFSKLGLLKF